MMIYYILRFDEYINFIRTNKNINITIPNLINHAISFFIIINLDLYQKILLEKNI
jgi:hypothetical protein